MASNCSMFEEFSSLSIGQLKDYLSSRGISSGGNKNELVSRAFVAWENKVDLKLSETELQEKLSAQYKSKLTTFNIEDPKLIPCQSWESNVSVWPKINLGTIFAFILEKKEFDLDFVGHYKTHKAYSYWKSGFVDIILTYKLGDLIYIKSKVTPSQSIHGDPRDLWIVFDAKEAKILTCWCSCIAGMAETCNHIIAVLYKIEYANNMGYTDPFCTSLPCNWNESTRKIVQPVKVLDMFLRRDNRKNETTEQTPKTLNTEARKLFDPRRVNQQKIDNDSLSKLLSNLHAVTPKSVLFKAFPKQHTSEMPLSLTDFANSYTGSVDEFLENLTHIFNKAKVSLVEQHTREQSSCTLWHEQRKGRITASSVYDVYHKILKLSKANCSKVKVSHLIANIMGKGHDISSLPAVQYGSKNETTARDAFIMQESLKHSSFVVKKSGLFIKHDLPFLAASPDGTVNCNCCGFSVLEIKCPYVLSGKSVHDGWQDTDFLQLQDGVIHLKKTHKYYFQIQTQMAVTGCKVGYFVVWTTTGPLFVEKITFDSANWSAIQDKLALFFKTYIVPHLLQMKELHFCPMCDNVCVEEDEIMKTDENSVMCDVCNLWHHWKCVSLTSEPTEESWICNVCKNSFA